MTPAAMSEEQTVSTLRFATQAKSIKNHAQVNEVLDDAAKINRLKKEMAAMKAELEAARAQSVGNREAELQEALDAATKDKENLLVRVLEANREWPRYWVAIAEGAAKRACATLAEVR